MTFSPFNPIYFHKSGIPEKDAMSGYVHLYSTADRILVEILHKVSEEIPSLRLADTAGATVMELTWSMYQINSDECVTFYELTGLEVGEYVLSFGEWQSNTIQVTDMLELLDKTVLLQYSNRANGIRTDIYPVIKGRMRYFEMRVVGGFKDSDWSFSVENEHYITSSGDILELFAFEATDKILTIGNSAGVPVWVAMTINCILSCELVFIDGNRYSTPNSTTIDAIGDDMHEDMFVYTATLRMDRYVNAKFESELSAIFRRTPDAIRRSNKYLRRI